MSREKDRQQLNSTLDLLMSELGLPPIPEELASKAKEMSKDDVLRLTVKVLTDACGELASLVTGMQKRCGTCERQGNGKECAHCIADAMRYGKVMMETTALMKLTVIATEPGSRMAGELDLADAQHEAEHATKH